MIQLFCVESYLLFFVVIFILLLFFVIKIKKTSPVLNEPTVSPPASYEKRAEDYIKEISDFIYSHGIAYPKKHGSWILLSITDSVYFYMDSFNGAIWYCEGSPVYEYWTGFANNTKKRIYLGLSNSSWRGHDKLPLSNQEYIKYILIIVENVLSYSKQVHHENI